ncbi:MAG TPA: hypothetical protein VMV69_17495 [Pirellulales bacterium]|nr:hypothetical protein [Pirellulales bacterium]
MSDTAHHPPPEPRPSHGPGHETRDVSGLYVSIFALALAAAVGLVLLLLIWLFDIFEARAERRDPLQSPLAGKQVPPEPRLEETTGATLSVLRLHEDNELTTYGWIDRRKGVVRLPIDRAIDLLAERGLPEPEGPAMPDEKPGAGGEPPDAPREDAP